MNRWVLSLGLLAVAVVRVVAIALGWGSLESDPDAYRALAATWHDTGVLGRLSADGVPTPSAYRPPLYPWLISWFSSSAAELEDRWWIGSCHVLLGTATCVLTLAIARRLRLSPAMGWFAVLGVACDPILLRQSTLVMTETTATFLGAWIWWWWLRSESRQHDRWSLPAMLLGVGMGIAMLCRPTALAWIALWWIASLAMRRWRWVIASAVGVVLAIAPWTLRNAVQWGRPIATTTHGGYTLYLANNPILYDHWGRSVSREWDEERFHERWRDQRSQVEPGNELELDRLAQSLAWSTITGDPASAIRGCGIRLGWFWAWWPSSRQASAASQCAIGLWYAVTTLLALVGVGHAIRGRWRREWLPGLLLVVSLSVVHSVYWSNMRMRAPAIPVIVLLAGLGIERIARRIGPEEPGQAAIPSQKNR